MKFLHCDFGALLTAAWVALALVVMAPSKPTTSFQKAFIPKPASTLIRTQIVNSPTPSVHKSPVHETQFHGSKE
ncbi:MAG: hypothetical protein HC772_10350 [Leptolyngbyaceae cyanobacterium CRU_2_3]|nr:hypothetical protein [Leptolyngbyaceae cyanobacterium CRU_2_3]